MTVVVFPFDTKRLFERCVKQKEFPRNDFEKQAVLLEILKEFDDRIYSEKEVNKTILQYFEDYALLRRELINFGYMQRDPVKATYWVVKRGLTAEDIDKNTRLKKHAKAYGF